MVDFAGSGVVHVTGGVTALLATIILGPRRGRFHDESGRRLAKPKDFPGSSISLQMLGTFILWFGWYGFNCGSALPSARPNAHLVAALAGVNTTLSGGTAGLTALFLNLYLLERFTGEPYFDLKFVMNGSLCGLVAVTGACGVVEPWAAIVIGVIAGMLYIAGTNGLIRLRLDDAVDAIPVHMINGIWGVVAVGLFASPSRLHDVYGHSEHAGWVYDGSDLTLLACQLVGLLFVCGWVFVIMFPFFIWLDWRGWFRSDPLEEIVGLDTSYHGGLTMLGGEDEVNPEYISQYKKRRAEEKLRRRGGAPEGTVTMGDSSYHGNDEEGSERGNTAHVHSG
jgi:Amt family ammonium transporter